MPTERFSHLDEHGDVCMVDISQKQFTARTAVAEGKIKLRAETLAAIQEGAVTKGNVLTTAKLAGIHAAKRTAELIPLCHPLRLTWVDLSLRLVEDGIEICATTKANDATGVEMEALTAVSVSALTVYDMCKAIDSSMRIEGIHLVEKRGGKSELK